MSFAFFHLKVTGLKSFINESPAVDVSMSSLYLSSDGAVTLVPPKAEL